MRNALKSLSKMKFLVFLIIIQLSLGLSMLYSTTSLIEENNIKQANFNRLFNFEKTYMVRIVPSNLEMESSWGETYNRYEKINKFYHKFEELKDSGVIDSYSILFPAFFEIEGLDELLPAEFKSSMNHRARILVNEDFIERKGIEVDEGRTLNPTDFKTNNNISILIGNGYKDKIPIGTTLDAYLMVKDNKNPYPSKEKFTLKVVGVMKHNSIPSLVAKNKYIENIVYSDYTIVIPSNETNFALSPGIAIGDQGVFIESNNQERLTNVINSDLKPLGLTTRVQSLREDYEGIMEELTRNIMNSVTLGGTLTILSVIGITTVLLGELRKRKKEFGIRLVSGATIKTICREVVYEIMFMMIFASVLSLIINWFMTTTTGGVNFMSNYLIVLNIGIVTFLTFIVSAIPIIKIRKMNVVDIVRGK